MIDEINECESGVMCTNFNNCESHDAYQRRDFHGFGTGHWCDDCYDSSAYPYRKDDYTKDTDMTDEDLNVNDD